MVDDAAAVGGRPNLIEDVDEGAGNPNRPVVVFVAPCVEAGADGFLAEQQTHSALLASFSTKHVWHFHLAAAAPAGLDDAADENVSRADSDVACAGCCCCCCCCFCSWLLVAVVAGVVPPRAALQHMHVSRDTSFVSTRHDLHVHVDVDDFLPHRPLLLPFTDGAAGVVVVVCVEGGGGGVVLLDGRADAQQAHLSAVSLLKTRHVVHFH